MRRRLAGSEMSVGLAVSRPCGYHGSPSNHSCAPPLEVFTTRGRKREPEQVFAYACGGERGGDGAAGAALTHTISYLRSPLCCKHVWGNRSR